MKRVRSKKQLRRKNCLLDQAKHARRRYLCWILDKHLSERMRKDNESGGGGMSLCEFPGSGDVKAGSAAASSSGMEVACDVGMA
eukprot:6405442-Ditylum_brightwellii.AAC.1